MTLSTAIDSRTTPGLPLGLLVGALLAVVAPTLIAAHDPPSITFYNQVLAVCAWGLWVWLLNRATGAQSRALRLQYGVDQAFAGLMLMAGVQAALALGAWAWGALPLGLAMMGSGLCTVAALVCLTGWRAGLTVQRDTVFDLFATALCVAGALGMALGLIQAFHPQWADGMLIAEPTMAGRAVGNLRQPNHLSTLLVWSSAAAIWLGARKRLPPLLAASLMALFIWGIVLTASRTGMLAMLFLAAWGLLDRRLPKSMRAALFAAPLIYGVFWGGMWLLSHLDQNVSFAAETRLHDKSDISSSRFKIWANVLSLVLQHPWAGVGYGEFNLAWTFTPFPTRPVAFFDHTHNLVLQWAVEFGLPTTIALVLLSLAAWLCLVWRTQSTTLTPAGACGVIVSTALLHSLLEYPLWYSYFLLPTAFAWGIGLASRARTAAPATTPGRAPWGLSLAAALTMAGAIWCALDYQAAANIYAPRAGAGPLDARIAFGQKMPWFGYQADYADVTVPDEDEAPLPPQAFRRTLHNLVDARLMIAYARSLNAAGETDKARYVVARLKEFHNPMETAFLSPCTKAATASQAFQCQPPQRVYHWRELLPDQVASRTQ